LGGYENSFLVDGNTLTEVAGSPYVNFDTTPAPTTGEYLIYVDSGGNLGKVQIGSDLWDTDIYIVDMKNTVAGTGTITWTAASATLTYQAPDDGAAGTAVYIMGDDPSDDPHGYYKLYSSNTDNWVIVRVVGALGGNNSSTITIVKDETDYADEAIIKLAVVNWNNGTETLSNLRDIRSFVTADNRTETEEEHDSDGKHTKVLQQELRVNVGTNDGAIFGLAASMGVIGAAANNSGIYGSASTQGVVGWADGDYGVDAGAGNDYAVYGDAANDYGIFGIAGNNTGVYGKATHDYGGYFLALDNTGVFGSADTYGVYGSAIASYGGYFKASATGVYGSASNTAVYGYAPLLYGGYFKASESAVYASASNTAVYGVASASAVYASAANNTGFYGIASSYGAYITATEQIGIYAEGRDNTAIYAVATNPDTVAALTITGIYSTAANPWSHRYAIAIVGVADNSAATGIYGSAGTAGTGVRGAGVSGVGVLGTCLGDGVAGVLGSQSSSIGVKGLADNTAVYGLAGAAYGVHGKGSSYGIFGSADANVGVYGLADGDTGGYFVASDDVGCKGVAADTGGWFSGGTVGLYIQNTLNVSCATVATNAAVSSGLPVTLSDNTVYVIPLYTTV
jgi:hypothetical protein